MPGGYPSIPECGALRCHVLEHLLGEMVARGVVNAKPGSDDIFPILRIDVRSDERLLH